MVDPNNFAALWRAIQEHPDFVGAVIWQRDDIEMAAEEYGVDFDELDKAVDMSGWQNAAIEDGWNDVIYHEAYILQEKKEGNNK